MKLIVNEVLISHVQEAKAKGWLRQGKGLDLGKRMRFLASSTTL